jgi:hypothetical protein
MGFTHQDMNLIVSILLKLANFGYDLDNILIALDVCAQGFIYWIDADINDFTMFIRSASSIFFNIELKMVGFFSTYSDVCMP